MDNYVGLRSQDYKMIIQNLRKLHWINYYFYAQFDVLFDDKRILFLFLGLDICFKFISFLIFEYPAEKKITNIGFE